jgi:hypothetical protein
MHADSHKKTYKFVRALRGQVRRPVASLRPFAGVSEGNFVGTGAGTNEAAAPAGPISCANLTH